MKSPKRRSDCPINFALEIFGDKWSLLIIRDLMFQGKRTYGDFIDSEEKIATNILADRLSRLETTGLIKGIKDRENKRKNIYFLTDMGTGLVPVMLEIVRWSALFDENTGAPREFVERIENDRKNFINEITKQLKQTSGQILSDGKK